MDERERYTERWHGAFRDWSKPLSLLSLSGLTPCRPSRTLSERAVPVELVGSRTKPHQLGS